MAWTESNPTVVADSLWHNACSVHVTLWSINFPLRIVKSSSGREIFRTSYWRSPRRDLGGHEHAIITLICSVEKPHGQAAGHVNDPELKRTV